MTTNEHKRDLVRRPMITASPLQRYMPGTFRQEQHEHLVLAALGGEGVEENYAFVHGPIALADFFRLARSFFGSDEFAIVVESDTNDFLVDFLEANGWSIDEDVPSMLLCPIPEIPQLISEIEIRTVTTEEEFDAFMRISATGLRWVPSLEAATDPNVCLLVGYLDGEPVATSRISCLGDVGEINGVVTSPLFRRRGFGTEMTWAIIAEGTKRGCEAMVLTATELGYPVYLKMGFVPVCNYRTYLPPDSGLNTTSEGPARAPIGN